MNQEWRCDCCKRVFFEKNMTRIIDSKGRIWFRCRRCAKEWGDKPRSNGYYTYIQFEGVTGLEDPRKIVIYGPN